VSRKDPRDDDRRVFSSEHLICQRHGRRAGRDPIETVENREDREADNVKLRERYQGERKSAQPVIPEEQEARVEAIAQPARGGRADQAERAN
jgi:hypothetical protein